MKILALNGSPIGENGNTETYVMNANNSWK